MSEHQTPGSPEKFFHTDLSGETSVERVRDERLRELSEKMESELFSEAFLRNLFSCLWKMRDDLLKYGTFVGVLGDVPGGHLPARIFQGYVNEARLDAEEAGGADWGDPARLHLIDGRTKDDARRGAEALADDHRRLLIVSPYADSGESERYIHYVLGQQISNYHRIDMACIGAAESQDMERHIRRFSTSSHLFTSDEPDAQSLGEHLRDFSFRTERDKIERDIPQVIQGFCEMTLDIVECQERNPS